MTAAVRIFQPRVVLHGKRVAMVSDIRGQIEADGVLGLFAGDTRLLSTYKIEINGNAWRLLSRAILGHGSAEWHFQNPPLRDEFGSLEGGVLAFILKRRVDGALHDDLDISAFAQRPVRFRLTLQIDADFADIFEVKGGSIPPRMRTRRSATPEGVLLEYDREGFQRGLHVRITPSGSRGHFVASRISFDVMLEHAQAWHCCIDAEPEIDRRVLRLSSDPHRPEPDPVDSAHRTLSLESLPLLDDAFRCGHEDLHALAIRNEGSPAFVAAGIPWFLTLFGRDSMLPALLTGIDGCWAAEGALAALAPYQARERDDFRDAEPGKFPHELRFDEKTSRGELPFSPYYGTHDAPSLYCLTLWHAWRWTGRRKLVEEHIDSAMRGLRWCDEHGDRDGDGLQEYGTRSPVGYRNQSWKDAGDAIVDARGKHAELPIATIELQAYLFAARLAMAELFAALGDPNRAAEQRHKARALRERVEQAYWMEDRGFYAIALDGRKRPVDSISSNPGHLLWCGLARPERAASVARRLMKEDMFSGWGLRTLSSRNPAYNPLSYQRGSVWPFDTLLAAAGLWRYGEYTPALILMRSILEAARAFESNRLPELFAGFERGKDGTPAPYEEANAPQAWSAAVPIAIAQLLLGIVPDAPRQRCFVRPNLPEWLPCLSLSGIRVGEGTVSVRAVRRGAETILDAIDANGIEAVPDIPPSPLWGAPPEV